jgi:gliding motility-associated lipoprotein GldH
MPDYLYGMFRTLRYGFYLVLISTLVSCGGPSPQFQDHMTVPKNAWNYSFKPNFKFNITDTTAGYQLLFLVRHTDAYPFNNIWLMMETKGPGDTTFTKMRVEVRLAAPDGKWLGRGMGDIYEQRAEINSTAQPAVFPKSGEYTIRLSQDMRRNPLPEVMQVGLRLVNLGTMPEQQKPVTAN